MHFSGLLEGPETHSKANTFKLRFGGALFGPNKLPQDVSQRLSKIPKSWLLCRQERRKRAFQCKTSNTSAITTFLLKWLDFGGREGSKTHTKIGPDAAERKARKIASEVPSSSRRGFGACFRPKMVCFHACPPGGEVLWKGWG